MCARAAQVRSLGALLNVPEPFLKRHPFPGPGMAVRVLGDVTAEGALEVRPVRLIPAVRSIWAVRSVSLALGVAMEARRER